MMFFKKEVSPPQAPSLVMLRAEERPSITGLSSWVPNSDHVPQLTKMKSFSFAGTAASAHWVSCPATATTDSGSTSSSSQMRGSSAPSSVPG